MIFFSCFRFEFEPNILLYSLFISWHIHVSKATLVAAVAVAAVVAVAIVVVVAVFIVFEGIAAIHRSVYRSNRNNSRASPIL